MYLYYIAVIKLRRVLHITDSASNIPKQLRKIWFSLAQLAEKIQRSNSGPVQHNFTLAELISNVGEVTIYQSRVSQANFDLATSIVFIYNLTLKRGKNIKSGMEREDRERLQKSWENFTFSTEKNI